MSLSLTPTIVSPVRCSTSGAASVTSSVCSDSWTTDSLTTSLSLLLSTGSFDLPQPVRPAKNWQNRHKNHHFLFHSPIPFYISPFIRAILYICLQGRWSALYVAHWHIPRLHQTSSGSDSAFILASPFSSSWKWTMKLSSFAWRSFSFWAGNWWILSGKR